MVAAAEFAHQVPNTEAFLLEISPHSGLTLDRRSTAATFAGWDPA